MTYAINWKKQKTKIKTPTQTPASPAQKQLWPTPGLAECAAHLSCVMRKSSKNQTQNSQRPMWTAKVASRLQQQSDVDGLGAQRNAGCCEYDVQGDLQRIDLKRISVVTIKTLLCKKWCLSSSAHLCVSLQGVSQLAADHWSILVSRAALSFLQPRKVLRNLQWNNFLMVEGPVNTKLWQFVSL